jgi:hypothetical protein
VDGFRTRAREPERLAWVLRPDYCIAFGFKGVRDKGEYFRFVVHDEDGFSRPGR